MRIQTIYMNYLINRQNEKLHPHLLSTAARRHVCSLAPEMHITFLFHRSVGTNRSL